MKLEFDFLEQQSNIPLQMAEQESEIKADFGEIQTVTEYVGGELYEGNYIVTPKVEAQTMPTKGKVMVEDVTVRPIPFF